MKRGPGDRRNPRDRSEIARDREPQNLTADCMMHGFSLIKAEPGGRFARLLINTKYMLLDSRIVIVNGV